MSIQKRIEILDRVGKNISRLETYQPIINTAFAANSWFEPRFIEQAFSAICKEFLDADKLNQWLKSYFIEDDFNLQKRVGIVCAGNIPMVGFHDFLCCYILGIPFELKLSSKDSILMKFIIGQIIEQDENFKQQNVFVNQLKNFDAVIATGSNSSNRYFKHYFGKYPNILRNNRTAVAVLNGNESDDMLKLLADDVLLYFGLGCRNISKVYIPESFEPERLFSYFSHYKWMHQSTQYMNNYDYNRTILLMNNTPHFANDFLMLQESDTLHSPIATLYFERYTSIEEAIKKINAQQAQIQCVIGNGKDMIPFGEAQHPSLSDYADGVDTIGFLLGL